MQLIIPNLYLGDISSILYISKEEKEKIKRVVNTAGELENFANYPLDKYLHIPLKDDGTFEDLMVFNDSIRPFIKFMDAVKLEDSPVLIHCQMGMSRSCSMLAVYLLHKGICKDFKSAVEYIVDKRPQAFHGGTITVYELPINEHFCAF